MQTIEKECEGKCVKCGSDIEYYEAMVPEDECVYYPYECRKCGSMGEEHYTLTYDLSTTRVEKVITKNK